MNIALLLTFGMSLSKWKDIGILERELVPYQKLSKHGIHTIIYSYGDPDLESSIASFYGFKIFYLSPLSASYNNLFFVFIESFIRSIVSRHPKLHVIRTNQLFGFWNGLLISFRYSIPLMIRSGYELHSFWLKTYSSRFRHIFSFLISWVAYKCGTVLEFTSLHDIRYVVRYFKPSCDLLYRPNWIDTNLFRPLTIEKTYSSITVGRLTPQKNHLALLKAIATSSLPKPSKPLLFIGTGPCKDQLLEFAHEHCIPLVIKDTVSNNQIPEFINSSMFYVHCSLFEGNPKSLLEALSCGVPVIAISNPRLLQVFGSSDCIFFEALPSIPSFYSSSQLSSSKAQLMSINSRNFIESHFSLNARISSLRCDIINLHKMPKF